MGNWGGGRVLRAQLRPQGLGGGSFREAEFNQVEKSTWWEMVNPLCRGGLESQAHILVEQEEPRLCTPWVTHCSLQFPCLDSSSFPWALTW